MTEQFASTIRITQAASAPQLVLVRELFLEYAAGLGFSLCFQGFEHELEGLPGKYAPPDGSLLLATANDRAAGCVAVRRMDADCCEMKRLFVRPEFRRTGLGHRLAEQIVMEARLIGYHRMRLDTLSSMTAAQSLYRALGFKEIEPYYDNPICGAVYLELVL